MGVREKENSQKFLLGVIIAGAMAAFFSAVTTFVGIVIAMTSSSDDRLLELLNHPTNLIDVVALLTLGVFILRKSRSAALLMLGYWVIGKAYQIFGLDFDASAVINIGSLLFLCIFILTVWGTFKYHNLEKAKNPGYKPIKKWHFFVGAPITAIALLLVIVNFLTIAGVFNTGEVISGSDLTSEEREWLVANEIIHPNENVELFYITNSASVMEGGVYLTDYSVGTYYVDENGELLATWLWFTEVSSVELVEQGNSRYDSTYQVNGPTEELSFQFLLPTNDYDDVKFAESIRKRVRESQEAAEDADQESPILLDT